MNEKEERKKRVCKFQRVFGIVLVVLGIIGILVSIFVINITIKNSQSTKVYDDQTDTQIITWIIKDVNVDLFYVEMGENIILLSAIFILIGILFYTEGRKGYLNGKKEKKEGAR
jgi:multisubunit Na+/H+ antiporter MnhB subunit